MKYKRNYLKTFIIINLLFVLVCSNTAYASNSTVNKSWPQGPKVDAESAIIMEASTGTILYSKNIDEKRYPASITKIMTTLLAAENSSLNETVTFTQDCFYNMEYQATHIGATVGEKLTMEQCLYAVMLASANEVSNAVAIHVAGSVSNFTTMMNERAKEFGATNTHFNNPNGLHEADHYTTAHDMALIMQAAMKNQNFRMVTGTKRYQIQPTNKCKEIRYLSNHHQMINPTSAPKYGYEYAIGGKTGYTSDAGNTLVTVAKKDGIELICVVLKGKSSYVQNNVYTDTISLFDFFFENYSVYNIGDNNSVPTIKEDKLFTRFNSFFNSNEAPIRLNGKNTVVIPNTKKLEDVVQTVSYYNDVTIDPNASTIIGKITYTLDDVTVGENDIIYDTTKTVPRLETETKVVEKNGTTSSLTDIFKLSNKATKKTVLVLLGIVVVIIIGLYITLRVLRYKRRKRYYASRRKTHNVTNIYKKYKKS
ncbi:MAG: D-alanyl-D-alanine carboxypeptidase family protein [bacterium]|nr:D-alanyl-D-alanine carboxypeptidase family protein [bacterium]